MSAPLRFRRDSRGFYVAESDTLRYTVHNYDPGPWLLEVRTLTTTAGIRHAVGQPVIATAMHDTKSLCVAVARAFHDLGEDYQQHEHGGRSRLTEATLRAYDADKAAHTTTEEN